MTTLHMIRFFFFGSIFMHLFFFALRAYWRSLRTEELEQEWAGMDPSARPERDWFIAREIKRYKGQITRRAILAAYVLPTLCFGSVIFFINYA